MKKISIIGIIILALLVGSVSGARVITSTTAPPIETSYIIKVGMISQIPDPAEPGNYVDLRFKFENNGSQVAKDIEAELIPEYPFSLDPGTSAKKFVGSVNPQQRGDNGVIIKYRVRVDKDALEGQNDIKLRYRIDGGGWITLEEFDINIQPFDAILLLESVKSNPETIKPGEQAQIELGFNNLADILLRRVGVKINFDGMPLAPIKSTNEKFIDLVDKNQKSKLIFDVIAEPDAESGIYKIPVNFNYYDSLGNRYFGNNSIGIIIGAEPDLSYIIDSTTIYQAGRNGEITVKIVNKGVNDIKFLNVKIHNSDKYTIISPSKVYIGNIDSDDYETADFTMFVKNSKDSFVTLPFTFEYKDANNVDFVKEINLELPLYDTNQAKQFGLVQGSNAIGFFIIIIVVGAGIFLFLRWRKKRKK